MVQNISLILRRLTSAIISLVFFALQLFITGLDMSELEVGCKLICQHLLVNAQHHTEPGNTNKPDATVFTSDNTTAEVVTVLPTFISWTAPRVYYYGG